MANVPPDFAFPVSQPVWIEGQKTHGDEGDPDPVEGPAIAIGWDTPEGREAEKEIDKRMRPAREGTVYLVLDPNWPAPQWVRESEITGHSSST